MLKKAGIIVAAAAAGLLALSPLAFAGDEAINSVSDDSNTVGLVNVTDNEANVPVQLCNNDVAVGALGGAVNDALGSAAGAISGGDSTADSVATDNEQRTCSQENSSGGLIDQNISR